MERQELQEFLYFLTHSKQLTRAQQRKRDNLLAKNLVTINRDIQPSVGETNNDGEDIGISKLSTTEAEHRLGVKAKYTSPKNIQQFLQDYNQDNVLKYTCHLIDADEVISGIINDCDSDTYDFFKHIELIKKHLFSLMKLYEERGAFLSPNIITLIHVYITGKDIMGENRTWSTNRIDVGWGCDEIVSWANQNPGKIPNPGPNIVKKQKSSGFALTSAFNSKKTGKRVKSFSDLVIFFKSQFHIRSDNSLKKILSYVNQDRWSDSEVIFSFSQDRFSEGVELLTDVDKLIQAYVKIINLCIENKDAEEPAQIELFFYDEPDTKFTYFEIHHLNSCYKKTLKSSIERIGESQARLIEKQINGLCDLFVEARFSDGSSARINLWDQSPDLSYTQTNSITGVKYILRF